MRNFVFIYFMFLKFMKDLTNATQEDKIKS